MSKAMGWMKSFVKKRNLGNTHVSTVNFFILQWSWTYPLRTVLPMSRRPKSQHAPASSTAASLVGGAGRSSRTSSYTSRTASVRFARAASPASGAVSAACPVVMRRRFSGTRPHTRAGAAASSACSAAKWSCGRTCLIICALTALADSGWLTAERFAFFIGMHFYITLDWGWSLGKYLAILLKRHVNLCNLFKQLILMRLHIWNAPISA